MGFGDCMRRQVLLRTIVLGLVTAACWAFSGAAAACTLEGKWRADKTKTLAELYGSRVSNAEKMKLAKQYRDATIDYSGCNKMYTRRGKFEEIRHFEIVEDTREYVIIRFKGSDEMALLTRQGRCYKTPVQGKAYYEHYCKI